ncbi:MAG: LacI family transcriptional regulator, partial [Spirochaetaceae bacterium]
MAVTNYALLLTPSGNLVMEKTSNLSIAFLTTFIDNMINKHRFFGVADRARQEGATLFCFLPRFLNDRSGFDRQANVLIDFVTSEYFDGVIVGNIIREDNATEEEVRDLFSRFSLPHVSIHENKVGVPFIPTDNAGGIALIIQHLARVHKCRKIAYVRGPQQHPYAEQRICAFRESMMEEGIVINENLITPPASWWYSNFQVILDERNLTPGRDFDAVVCANDILAIEAIKMMQERGYSIPRDVLVTGFNDTVECTVFTPTLTSVRLPFYQQGVAACDMLFNLMKRKGSSNSSMDGSDGGYTHVKLPDAELMVRDSCGCVDPVVRELAEIKESGNAEFEEPDFQGKVRKIFSAVLGTVLPDTKDVEELASQFIEYCLGSLDDDSFFRVFRHLLNKTIIRGGDIGLWSDFLASLRTEILLLLRDTSMTVSAETLFHQMRTYMFQTCIRLEKTATLEYERLSDGIRKFGVALISTFDINIIMDETANYLAKFGIATCYVSLYEDPSRPAAFSNLMLAVKDGKRIPLPGNGFRFASCEIVPRQYLHQTPDACYIVSALFFRDRQIGFICFRMTRRDTVIYD